MGNKTNNPSPFSVNEDASTSIQFQEKLWEHEQKTVWRKDMILTWAKAIIMVAFTLACATIMILVAYHQNNDMMKTIATIVSCVLSFAGGRATRR